MLKESHMYEIIYRIGQHLLFWVLSFFGFAYLFKIGNAIQSIDYFYAGFFHISLVVGAYFNLIILIPKFFQKRKYFSYTILILFTIGTSYVLHNLVFDHLIELILPGYFIISFFDTVDILIFIITYLSTTSLLKLSRGWFKLQDLKHQLVKTEKEKYYSQLNALKAQINPHFLFNSLNVLHALALKNSDQSPDAIIKLSDILRYVIYDSNKEKIKISNEVKLIEDYISLQKYRIEESSKIKFSKQVEKDNELAPMLFLPLIENSFKHGIKGGLNNTYLKIRLSSDLSTTIFEIENNKGKSEGIDLAGEGGIGLQNMKNRLKLIYPERHVFKIIEIGEMFKVKLLIKHEN
ncbi:MAG: sensor histidine kinase [Flammeovirgaceae bacterium]|nr:sensor histidine kinase [Flammeovirgaceae bacterium]